MCSERQSRDQEKVVDISDYLAAMYVCVCMCMMRVTSCVVCIACSQSPDDQQVTVSAKAKGGPYRRRKNN